MIDQTASEHTPLSSRSQHSASQGDILIDGMAGGAGITAAYPSVLHPPTRLRKDLFFMFLGESDHLRVFVTNPFIPIHSILYVYVYIFKRSSSLSAIYSVYLF